MTMARSIFDIEIEIRPRSDDDHDVHNKKSGMKTRPVFAFVMAVFLFLMCEVVFWMIMGGVLNLSSFADAFLELCSRITC